MNKRLIIYRFVTSLSFLACLHWLSISRAQAQQSIVSKIAGAESEVTVSYHNERCQVRQRNDIAPSDGLPVGRQIFCDDMHVGSINFQANQHRGQINDSETARQLLFGGNVWASMQQRLQCAKALPVLSRAFVFSCKTVLGGFPHVVLLLNTGSYTTIAEGPPTILQSLLHLAVSTKEYSPDQSDALSLRDANVLFESLFGQKIILLSARESAEYSIFLQQAKAANANGNFREAERRLRRALDLQSRVLEPDNLALLNTLLDLALNLSNQGRDEETLALFRRVEPMIQQSTRDADRARFTAYRAYHEANLGRYAPGLQFASAAVSAWRKIVGGPNLNFSLIPGNDGGVDPRAGEKGELALALNVQANMAIRNEEFELADAAASEAFRIMENTRGLPTWWKPDILLTLGKVSSARGRLSAAEAYLTTALKMRRLISGDGTHNIPILIALAGAYQREGLNTSAIITFREAFALAKSSGPFSEFSFRPDDLIPFGLAVSNYAKSIELQSDRQGLLSEAFDAFQLFRSETTHQTLQRAAEFAAQRNNELSKLVDQLRAAERVLQVSELELASETALDADQRSSIVENGLSEKIVSAKKELSLIRGSLKSKFPDYLNMLSPKPLDSMEIRKRLRDDEGVLVFLLGEQEGFVQLIRRDGIALQHIKLGRSAIAERVSQLRKAFEVQTGAPPEFNLELSFDLHEDLIAPLGDSIQGLKQLVVIANGPLASIPFSVLVTAKPPVGNVSYSDIKWFGQAISISHLGSLDQFFNLRSTGRAKQATKGMLAFANPLLSGEASQEQLSSQAPQDGSRASAMQALASSCRESGPIQGSLLRALSPLPETSGEVRVIDQLLKKSSGPDGSPLINDLFLGEQATEQNFRTMDLAAYKILYFATHGLLPGELKCQAEPGLVLSPPLQARKKQDDGLLEASEIASLDINAELVVLSACNTAGAGTVSGGDTLSGLAQAFSFAGARNLVVSHWQVPSAATATLMKEFFVASGPALQTNLARSLQISQRKLIESEQTAHPYFWGAFVVMGDGQPNSDLPIPRVLK